MKRHAAICAVLSTLLVAGPGAAQQPEFTLQPASDFAPPGAVPLIIGGTQADPAEWPATFVFSEDGGGDCTSTAIGRRVLLTAAHCVGNGAHGVIDRGGWTTDVACEHHPAYHDNVADNDPDWERKVSPDFALCRLSEDLTDVELEWLNVDPAVPEDGSVVHLLGFGCNEVGGSDGGFGVLFEGNAAVHRRPEGDSYYTWTLGGAAICYGDSGGAAYALSDPDGSSRRVVAVNSRGDIDTQSLLSTTSVSGFLSWATTWSSTHGLRICGLHADATHCRPQ